MESTLRHRTEPRQASFVGGPSDGVSTMIEIEIESTGRPASHVYLLDPDGTTRHLYGSVFGADAEYQYLGSLVVASPRPY